MQRPLVLLRDQGVAFLRAEMRDVDAGQRIGRFHPEKRFARHFFQTIAGFQNRKGAFKPPQVVDRNVILQGHQFPMIFHHGFFGSGAATAAGCSTFCATVLAVVIGETWGETD